MIVRRLRRFISLGKPSWLMRMMATSTSRSILSKPTYFFSDFDLNKHKNEAKQFYQQQVESIVELEKKEDWETHVMKSPIPVVLDCYADWCEPCKKLTPILEAQAKGADNWKLVKMNIDKFKDIANMLQLKAVPTVYLVYNGRSIDGFSGMPDEKILKGFFGSLQKVLTFGEEGQRQAARFDVGRSLMKQQKWAQAEQVFKELLDTKLTASLQPITKLLLAQCFNKQHKLTNYQQTIKQFKETYKREMQSQGEQLDMLRQFIQQLDNQYQKLRQQPLKDDKIDIIKQQIAKQPKNLQLQFQLATVYQQKQLLEEAIQTLLDIIKADKNWEDKKAHKQLLEIFKKLGQSSPTTTKYRKIYQRLLY